jgi:hypothetical protein
LLGARSQTPWVGFAEIWVVKPSAEQNYDFWIFFWKEKGYWGVVEELGLFEIFYIEFKVS